MKKSKIVILAISLIVVTSITLISVLGINKKNDYNRDISEETENINNETNTNYENTENTENTHNFWLAEYKFPKETKQLSQLYGDLISIPIKLTDFEGKCDYFEYGYNREAKKIGDIDIILTRTDDYTTVKLRNYDKTWFEEISWFEIKNLTKEDKSTQECIENGWWYTDQIDIDEALDIDMSKNDEYKPGKDERALMEAVIEKMGAPTYVYLQSSCVDTMKEKDGVILYSLVYEFEEYTLELPVSEIILAEYDVYECNTADYETYYYPKQYWEKEKSEWDVVETIEHNNIKLIIIK